MLQLQAASLHFRSLALLIISFLISSAVLKHSSTTEKRLGKENKMECLGGCRSLLSGLCSQAGATSFKRAVVSGVGTACSRISKWCQNRTCGCPVPAPLSASTIARCIFAPYGNTHGHLWYNMLPQMQDTWLNSMDFPHGNHLYWPIITSWDSRAKLQRHPQHTSFRYRQSSAQRDFRQTQRTYDTALHYWFIKN